ncbi:MAG: hypothetical protein HQ551_02255 [Desulfobacteraceae bacterium]|nr:hypothetical protein [Desulfobacteraceae bacterium]
MLEIKKTAIAFDENELIKLEGIIIDEDEAEALKFLKRAIYNKIAKGQQDRLKSHLDTRENPMEGFRRNDP